MAGNRNFLDIILGRDPNQRSSAFFFPTRTRTSSGENITVENALQNPTVLNCVNVIAQGIGQLNWGVHGPDGLPVEGHPINALVSRPNRFQTAYEFKTSIIIDLLVYGNSFTRITRSANGRVLELVPIDPVKMSVSVNPFGVPQYEHTEYGVMSDREVIHIRDIGGHQVDGRSRVLLAADRIASLNAADRLMGETFSNGVSLNYTVQLEGNLDDTSRKRLQDQLKAAFGAGGARRGGVAVIEGGQMNAIKGSTPADADLRDLRLNLINEIAALFRVPPSLVGGQGDETYNNITARLASMYRDTYAPIVTNIEQAFTNKLLQDPNNEIRFDVSDLVKGDLTSQVTIATTATGGAAFLTQNEAREFIGYQRMEGEGYDELMSTMAPEQAETDDRRGEGDTDTGNVGESGNG